MNPCTGRLAFARRNALCLTYLKIHQINLKKWVSGFSFALKNHLPPIGAEVTFTGTATFEGQLPSSVNESRFQFLSFCRIGCRDVRIRSGSGVLGICRTSDADANAECNREPPRFSKTLTGNKASFSHRRPQASNKTTYLLRHCFSTSRIIALSAAWSSAQDISASSCPKIRRLAPRNL